MIEGLICRMITDQPEKRIDWPELFDHPIIKALGNSLQDVLSETLGKMGNLLFNMNKFYIKQNMVILHPTEILKR
jgi:serine/threonine-protein kinase ULK/ATG1